MIKQKPYQSLIMYYFTGTGNALCAGRWIAEEARKRSIVTCLHPIDRSYKPDMNEFQEKSLAAFLYPTHGFSLAPSMLYFILRFPRRKGTDVFLLNTRAGSKIGKWQVPGLSGMAQLLPMLVLKLKGYRIRGGLPLDMPSNWISLHPAYKKSWVDFLVGRCEKETRAFSNDVLDGKRKFKRVLISLPLDLAVFPIAVMYFIIGRFGLAKMMIYSTDCDSCLICVKNCPVGAISIKGGRPSWSFHCESCMRCINLCPRTAIQTSHLIIAITIIMASVPFAAWMLIQTPFAGIIDLPLAGFLIDNYIALFIVYILYILIQRLLKVRFINFIFTRTSLTSYWKRYRAPGIGLQDYKTPSDGK